MTTTWRHGMNAEQQQRWFRKADEAHRTLLTKHNVWYGGPKVRTVDVQPEPEPELVETAPEPEPAAPIFTPISDELSTAESIMAVCCGLGEITRAVMCSNQRAAHIANHRMAAAYLMTKHCKLSLPQIGRKIGGRDHSTVIHAKRRVMEDLAAGGERFGAIVEHVEKQLELA